MKREKNISKNVIPDFAVRRVGVMNAVGGFTLIELLVVVLIIGILAAVALPQYQKAVTKSRFAEALINLKSIAQANQICFLEQGEACAFDDLAIEVGETGIIEAGSFQHATKHFLYTNSLVDTNGNSTWALAQYRDEDVCLCYLQTGEIVLSQDHELAGFSANEPSFDYAKLLHIRDAEYDGCSCF